MTAKIQEYQVGTSIVSLRIGDILSSTSELIVSTDDDNFSMSGGVSRAILIGGGAEIQRDAQAQRAKRELGDMIETTAGSLPYRRVYHVISRFDGKHDPFTLEATKGCISKAVDNVIESLSRSPYSSVAFPAIGTGYGGHSPSDVAAAFASAVGKKLVAIQKPMRVELFIHPSQLSKDLSFLGFFRAFDDSAQWEAQAIRDHAVAMVHGIRTDARWHDEIGGLLRKANPSINPVPIGYGFFDVFSFLLPIPWIRNRLINKVASDLTILCKTKSIKHLSVIAHSFGTFLVAYALLRTPNLKIKRLILCGSVIPNDFKWQELRDQLDVIDPVNFPQVIAINDCGWRDVWPVFAHTITFGYGSSGRYGFESPLVTNRKHNLKHSEFFNTGFVENFWVTAIVDGQIKRNDDIQPRGAWFLHVITRVHLKFVAALGAAVWLAVNTFQR